MSFVDSLILSGQTLISNGFGASVGLEAGYTQISSAAASKTASFFNLRRSDMRVLVGCGAAAAISAAFDAPLAGAFYAFELIIGTYTIATVAPVMAAALASSLVVHQLGIHSGITMFTLTTPATFTNYILFILLGYICALIGIGIMQGVGRVEGFFRFINIPPSARPVFGGVAVGLLALLTPQVLSGGHGALLLDMTTEVPMGMLLLLFILKAMASVISLGTGFRGGLFFASLLMGCLVGKFLGMAAMLVWPHTVQDPAVAAIIGMSAMAVSVVGGPLTMAFLALEMSGDYVIAGIALAASVVAALTVRELFGYSFSTWRMHLRGETIRSAHDVGWIRALTVGKLMQSNIKTMPVGTSLGDFRTQVPIGSMQNVIMVDDKGSYAGLLWVSKAYNQENTEVASIADLLSAQDTVLVSNMNVKEAMAVFERSQTEALAVVDNLTQRKVVGFLTEAYTVRRYAEELDRVHRSLAGQGGV